MPAKKAKSAWKRRTSAATTPAKKQEILVKRAAKVGKLGPKARAKAKELGAKKKAGTATPEELAKLAQISARRKASKTKTSSSSSSPKRSDFPGYSGPKYVTRKKSAKR